MGLEYDNEYVEFVQARVPDLRRLAYLLCGDWHRADDLVQATLVSLYVRWRRATASRTIEPYVRGMLVKQFLTERRRAWSRVTLMSSTPEPATPPASPGAPDDRTVLRGVLQRLPPRQRAVIVLRFLCDQSVNDVAELLNCSPGTVKSQTAHGLASLRRMLDEQSVAALGKEH